MYLGENKTPNHSWSLIEGSPESNSRGTDMAPLGLEVETSHPIFFLFHRIYFIPIIPNMILNIDI